MNLEKLKAATRERLDRAAKSARSFFEKDRVISGQRESWRAEMIRKLPRDSMRRRQLEEQERERLIRESAPKKPAGGGHGGMERVTQGVQRTVDKVGETVARDLTMDVR